MAFFYNSKSPTHFQIKQSQPVLFLNFTSWLTIFLLFLHFPFSSAISFHFPSFQANDETMYYQGNASVVNEVIQFTRILDAPPLYHTSARATYTQAIHLWDSETRNLTDFNTHFSFNITALDPNAPDQTGDGIAFFLSSVNATLPTNFRDSLLGLFDSSLAFTGDARHPIVAVEFDTFQNTWDPSSNHVGIDINSIASAANVTWNTTMKNGTMANAWVDYNSTTKTLSVYLTYAENPTFDGNYSLSHVVDLSQVLPEWVSVGFSASTCGWREYHTINSWTFNSTLGGSFNSKIGGSVNSRVGHKVNLLLVVGLAVGIGTLSCGVGLFWFIKLKKNNNSHVKNDMGVDDSIDDDAFEQGTGSRRFTFRELSHATNNFSEEGKLGQGGFGSVYRGLLSDTKGEIAVKRISRGSKQGKKEYSAEVKIISKLRHRNLVQLIGWCHEQGEFLLVYKFMPNGSLDTHLFGGKSILTWTVRYKIALGLASALLYLHELWELCVIHRDIKSSNIMLDSNYDARLGDFGLARLVDHELGLKTTGLAGTLGYLAPECVITNKATKESDIYSFGVVALEIACGKKPVVEISRDEHVRISEWVWRLYGKGQLFEAVDKDLQYDESQVERLILVGLWCCHPDPNLRPSIKQAINILTFEAPLPVLPSQMPTPVYYSSPSISMPSYSSSIQTAYSSEENTQCSSNSHTRSYHSSLSVESSNALQLNDDKEREHPRITFP